MGQRVSVSESEFRNAVLGWAGGRGDDGGAGQYSRFLNISSVHNIQKPFLHLVPEETWQPDTCTCLVSVSRVAGVTVDLSRLQGGRCQRRIYISRGTSSQHQSDPRPRSDNSGQ